MKTPRSPSGKRHVQLKQDRQSGTGMRGLPKKNGAGGKTVWGSALDQDPIAPSLDKNDPNYDSDNEEPHLPELTLSQPTLIPAANKDADKTDESAPSSAASSLDNKSSSLSTTN